ncbi:MAG: uL30 family ribosomal protein [Christensenellaceae bacterium]|jgi:large subunit ribosomal protein L30|nr:uL30 family ribosomal protein [Christensenellaceae bacterium]
MKTKTKVQNDGKKIRIVMIHGLDSCTKKQKAIAKALGFSRPNDTRELLDLPSTRGAVKKLEHLLRIEEVK